jgi:hypothetical protein
MKMPSILDEIPGLTNFTISHDGLTCYYSISFRRNFCTYYHQDGESDDSAPSDAECCSSELSVHCCVSDLLSAFLSVKISTSWICDDSTWRYIQCSDYFFRLWKFMYWVLVVAYLPVHSIGSWTVGIIVSSLLRSFQVWMNSIRSEQFPSVFNDIWNFWECFIHYTLNCLEANVTSFILLFACHVRLSACHWRPSYFT